MSCQTRSICILKAKGQQFDPLKVDSAFQVFSKLTYFKFVMTLLKEKCILNNKIINLIPQWTFPSFRVITSPFFLLFIILLRSDVQNFSTLIFHRGEQKTLSLGRRKIKKKRDEIIIQYAQPFLTLTKLIKIFGREKAVQKKVSNFIDKSFFPTILTNNMILKRGVDK